MSLCARRRSRGGMHEVGGWLLGLQCFELQTSQRKAGMTPTSREGGACAVILPCGEKARPDWRSRLHVVPALTVKALE